MGNLALECDGFIDGDNEVTVGEAGTASLEGVEKGTLCENFRTFPGLDGFEYGTTDELRAANSAYLRRLWEKNGL
jgi:hypothetical protein